MDRYCIIRLIGRKITQNKIGQEISEDEVCEVFGALSSVSQSEFYNAGQNGYKPMLRAQIWSFEYTGQNEAEIDGVRYSIIRSFKRADDKTELTLERRVGSG